MIGEGPGSLHASDLVRLPEDVVLEILARVHGVADLFRCAAVCKCWRAIDIIPAPHCSSLVGFLGQERRHCREGPSVLSFRPHAVHGWFLASMVPWSAPLSHTPLASSRTASCCSRRTTQSEMGRWRRGAAMLGDYCVCGEIENTGGRMVDKGRNSSYPVVLFGCQLIRKKREGSRREEGKGSEVHHELCY